MQETVQIIPTGQPKLISVEQLARADFWPEPVSTRTIRRRVKARQIPYKRFGGRIFFDPAEVRAWLDKKCTVKAL